MVNKVFVFKCDFRVHIEKVFKLTDSVDYGRVVFVEQPGYLQEAHTAVIPKNLKNHTPGLYAQSGALILHKIGYIYFKVICCLLYDIFRSSRLLV